MSLNFANYKRLSIPEGVVKMITRTSDGLVLWKASYVNMVPLSTTDDGTTIYNGTGYKDGYRVRSGGAEATQENGTCSGYIPAKGGDAVWIYGWDRLNYPDSAANAINIYDSSFTNLGQVSNYRYGIIETTYTEYSEITIVDRSDGVSKWVLPPAESGVAYIRVTGYDHTNGAPGSKLIVAINESIGDDPFAMIESNWTKLNGSYEMTVANDGVTIKRESTDNLTYVMCNHVFTRRDGTYSFSFTTNGKNANNYGMCVVRCFDASGNILTDVSAYTPNHSRSYNTAYQGFIMSTGYASFTFTLSSAVSTFQLGFAPSSQITVGNKARFGSFNLTEPPAPQGNLFSTSDPDYSVGRLNSSGAVNTSYTNGFVSGYISAAKGDVIRAKSANTAFLSDYGVIAFYDSSKTYINQIYINGSSGRLTMSSDNKEFACDTSVLASSFNNTAYVRIMGYGSPDGFIITKNEEIT